MSLPDEIFVTVYTKCINQLNVISAINKKGKV
jgi:hypothetical protein